MWTDEEFDFDFGNRALFVLSTAVRADSYRERVRREFADPSGSSAHERVHEESERVERGKRVLRGLTIWSEQYGLVGKADAVEIDDGPPLRVFPVEYKVGKNTGHRHALHQACAQALCLEEMFGVQIPEATVYYIASRQRETYELNEAIRIVTAEIPGNWEMKLGLRLPEPVADKRCPKCSLIDACMPFAVKEAAKQQSFALFVPAPEGEL